MAKGMARKRRPRPREHRGANRDAIPLNPGRPDSEVQDRLPLRELPPDNARMSRMGLDPLDYVRFYTLGECTVIVTREDGWHLSIAHPRRYPTWDEISQARYRLLPQEIWVAMYLPPPRFYMNVHRNCFQLKECPDQYADDPATGGRGDGQAIEAGELADTR